MELTELDSEERVVLLSLIIQLVGAVEGKTPEEIEELGAISDEMGKSAFQEALAEAQRRDPTRDQALALAEGVQRPEVRELMHTILFDLAAADFIAEEEREWIKAVADRWGIDTRV